MLQNEGKEYRSDMEKGEKHWSNCARGKKCDLDEQMKYDTIHLNRAKRHLLISLETWQKKKD